METKKIKSVIEILNQEIILASHSKARAKILSQFGFSNFSICPAKILEQFPKKLKEKPEKIVKFLAEKKAKNVFSKFPDKIILAADTIVVSHKNQILEKPKSKSEARKMILGRSENFEKVMTGFAIFYKNKKICGSKISKIFYHKILEKDVDFILQREDFKKVCGGISIEKSGGIFVKKISGDFWNIVGLPIFTVFEKLRKIFYKLA